MTVNFNLEMPWGGMKRVILNPDGTRVGYLDANNSDKWADGSLVDWTIVESSGQNCMVEIPKFYSCKKVIGDERIFGVTDKPIQTEKIGLLDWRIDPAFYRDRSKLCTDQTAIPIEVDFRYAPAFKGWVDASGRLRSLPNKTPTVGRTIGDFRTHSANMGNGWGLLDFNLLTAIQMLYITEYNNPDSQTTIGRGYVDGNASSMVTGATRIYGNSSFGETTGKKQMSYRGIEDLYGNVYHWIDGLFCDASRNILVGNKGFNNTGIGYKNLGSGGTADISGYIGDIQNNIDAGFLIKNTTGGTATTKLKDYGALWSGYLPVAGAGWAGGSGGGAFGCQLSYSASGSAVALGSVLCF